jgi:hypothetical protein
MGLWAKSVRIVNAIREHGTQSIRSLAERTGFSKRSVHRPLHAIARRDRDPESSLWETEAGRTWFIRFVVPTLVGCGRKRGVGADTLSAFFGRLPLEAPVGCSPSALRSVMHTWARLLLATAAAWEKEGIAHGEIRPVIGAVDETFRQKMLLVCMDLATGYLLREEVAADRSYETWFDWVNERLTTFGTGVLYMVSARAKALSKLAETGLNCLSIPDVLPLSHALAQGYALAIFGRLRQARRDRAHAPQRLETGQKKAPIDRGHVAQTEAQGAACATAVQHWPEVGRAWRQPLSNGARILHPWRLADSTRQTAHEVAEQWGTELEAIATLLAPNGLPIKNDILAQVRMQRAGVSALVDLWWQTVRQDWTPLALTPQWTQWAEDVLLPLLYGQEQLRRTRHPAQKPQIALVLQAVDEACARHPCTRRLMPEVLAGWQAWAGEHARAFQRASSAVEGRNGSLSQRQHTHRGLPTQRYQVWTVWHNCDCRAADGTTPASRFFRRSFPALCESVLSQIDQLPMPRQRRQALAASH